MGIEILADNKAQTQTQEPRSSERNTSDGQKVSGNLYGTSEPVAPYPPGPQSEWLPVHLCGTNDDELQELLPRHTKGKETKLPWRHALQLVHLRKANFGLRWTPIRGKEDVHTSPFCQVGPHWWLFILTWCVFFALATSVTMVTMPHAEVAEVCTGILLSALCLLFYLLTGCSDPGIVPSISEPADDTYTYCDMCASYRPARSLHCMDCRVCVEEYDHHCPWTGKCVGRGNVKYFYAWLFFLVLAFVYDVIEFSTYLLPEDDRLLDDTDYEDMSSIFQPSKVSMP